MVPRRQRDVVLGVERMAGVALGRRSKAYRRGIEPLLKSIRGAKSVKGLQRVMSATLARKLGTDAVTTALSEAMTQAAMIGRVASQPPTDK